MADNTPQTYRNAQSAPSETPIRDKNGKFLPHVRGKVRAAVLMMAYEGVDNNLAAQRTGVRIDNLNRALARPEVKKALNQYINEVRQNAAQKAYLRNIHLAQTSESDHVKADLNKWVAGVDGISPVRRVEGKHTVSHSFAGFSFDDQAIDITPDADETSVDG